MHWLSVTNIVDCQTYRHAKKVTPRKNFISLKL